MQNSPEQIREYAQQLQQRVLGDVVGTFLILQEQEGLDTPDINSQLQRETFTASVNSFDRLCTFLGENPATALSLFLKDIEDKAKTDEVIHLGAYLPTVTSDDLDQIGVLLERVESGEMFQQEPLTSSDSLEAGLVADLELLASIPHTITAFTYSTEDYDITPFSATLSPDKAATIILPAKNHSDIRLPFIPGAQLKVTISPYSSSRVTPVDTDTKDEDTFPTTISSHNILSTETNSRRTSRRTMEVSCLDNLSEPFTKKGSYFLDRVLGEPTTYLSDELKEEAQMFLDSVLGNVDLRNASSQEVLARIFNYVGSANFQSTRTDFMDQDFETLLQELQITGRYSGSCKSVATLIAGFCEAYGYSVRILDGQLFDMVDGSRGGHMWAEVLVPSVDGYVLMDAAGGNFGLYPDPKKAIYIVNGAILADEHATKDISLSVTVETV